MCLRTTLWLFRPSKSGRLLLLLIPSLLLVLVDGYLLDMSAFGELRDREDSFASLSAALGYE